MPRPRPWAWRRALSSGLFMSDDKLVIVDPGHPSRMGDLGAVSADGTLREVDLTYLIARRLLRLLRSLPVDSDITRGNGEVMSLGQRGAFVARRSEDYERTLVISIHFDMGSNPEWGNLRAFSGSGEGAYRTAESIQAAAPAGLFADRRPVIPTRETWPRVLNVLDRYKAPTVDALLVECGYLSNADDLKHIRKDSVRHSLAASMLCGVTRWLECWE